MRTPKVDASAIRKPGQATPVFLPATALVLRMLMTVDGVVKSLLNIPVVLMQNRTVDQYVQARS
jgi:hypothetical protein